MSISKKASVIYCLVIWFLKIPNRRAIWAVMQITIPAVSIIKLGTKVFEIVMGILPLYVHSRGTIRGTMHYFSPAYILTPYAYFYACFLKNSFRRRNIREQNSSPAGFQIRIPSQWSHSCWIICAVKPRKTFVRGRKVLDCFTHTGSFALHAGHYGAKEVTGVDISEYACEFAAKNAALNGMEDQVKFVAANAFDLLAEESRNGKQYDTIILDPPAFTKTRAAVESAARGYKEINLRAMKMIRPGGFLVTCSCSQHVLPEMFRNMVLDAARDAKVLLRQVEFRTQGKDHPILPYAQETEYLKCGIYQVFR